MLLIYMMGYLDYIKHIKAFVALSKKYNLDFNTVIIDWNECFAHKLRIEKGVIINDEEIEDDDAIYFEFF